MKIAILGTGGVGKAFAARLTGLGHSVMVGTRDRSANQQNRIVFGVCMSQNPGNVGCFAEAAALAKW